MASRGVIYPNGDLGLPKEAKAGGKKTGGPPSEFLSTTDAGKRMVAATYVLDGQGGRTS